VINQCLMSTALILIKDSVIIFDKFDAMRCKDRNLAAAKCASALPLWAGNQGRGLRHVYSAFKLQQHNNLTGFGQGSYCVRQIVTLHERRFGVSSEGRGEGDVCAPAVSCDTGLAAFDKTEGT
jgi:hypothetical protein